MLVIGFLTSSSLPCQFRKAPLGSTRKAAAEKQIMEAMSHRVHIDDSVKLIGKLLFGIEKGSELLGSVRPAGQSLVDDWDCLKTLVLFPLIYFVEFVLIRPFLTCILEIRVHECTFSL